MAYMLPVSVGRPRGALEGTFNAPLGAFSPAGVVPAPRPRTEPGVVYLPNGLPVRTGAGLGGLTAQLVAEHGGGMAPPDTIGLPEQRPLPGSVPTVGFEETGWMSPDFVPTPRAPIISEQLPPAPASAPAASPSAGLGALAPIRRDVRSIQPPPGAALTPAPAAAATPATASNPAVTPAVTPAAVTAEPRKSTFDQLVKSLGVGKADAGSSDRDRAYALLQAGLGTLAAASQPGATALGALGRGGLMGVEDLRKSEENARQRELGRIGMNVKILGLANDLDTAKSSLALKQADLVEKVRANKASESAKADLREATLKLAKKDLQLEAAKIDAAGGLKTENQIWTLARKMADADPDSYKTDQFDVFGQPVKDSKIWAGKYRDAAQRLGSRLTEPPAGAPTQETSAPKTGVRGEAESPGLSEQDVSALKSQYGDDAYQGEDGRWYVRKGGQVYPVIPEAENKAAAKARGQRR